MQSNIFIPKDIRLRNYIEYFWYIGPGNKAISVPDPILYPETSFDVVLSFASPAVLQTKSYSRIKTKGSFLLSGMRKEPFVVNCSGNEEYLAIRFYPDGLYSFLKNSLVEINSVQAVELTDLNGIFWKEITEKIASVNGLTKKVDTLEKELMKVINANSLSSSWVVNETLGNFHRSNEPVDINKVAKDLGVYPKRVEREFKKYIGTTPKLFSRILRFNNVIRYIGSSKPKSRWAETAQKFGYFDQSHFTKEFTNFLGLTPEKYMDLKNLYSL